MNRIEAFYLGEKEISELTYVEMSKILRLVRRRARITDVLSDDYYLLMRLVMDLNTAIKKIDSELSTHRTASMAGNYKQSLTFVEVVFMVVRDRINSLWMHCKRVKF